MNFALSNPDHLRHFVSSLPEVSLLAVVIISVKLLHPFEQSEPQDTSALAGSLQMDWQEWEQARSEHLQRLNEAGALEKGTATHIEDEDVLRLSGKELDDYLDWYEGTWIEPDRGQSRGLGKRDNVFNLFPLDQANRSTQPLHAYRNHTRKERDSVSKMVRQVANAMTVGSTSKTSLASAASMVDDLSGTEYIQYRQSDELNARALAFHQATAQLAAIRLETLLLAVTQLEYRLVALQRTRAREEMMKPGPSTDDDSSLAASGSEDSVS